MAGIETPNCLAASAKVPGASSRARRGITLFLHIFFRSYLKNRILVQDRGGADL